MLSGLNLTVYTATIGGTINTVETLGVFTSKVAELQVVSIDGSHLGLGSLGAGVGLLVTLLLLLLLLVVRVRVRSASSSEEGGPVEVRPVVRGADEVAYTVYDKVDLLSPATEVGDQQESYDEYLVQGASRQRLPPPPPCRGLRGRGEGDGGNQVGGNSSVDSLSSLLSHLHHQESVL